jgi:hypothetical protein
MVNKWGLLFGGLGIQVVGFLTFRTSSAAFARSILGEDQGGAAFGVLAGAVLILAGSVAAAVAVIALGIRLADLDREAAATRKPSSFSGYQTADAEG